MTKLAPDGEPFAGPADDPGLMASARAIADRLHGTAQQPEDVAADMGLTLTTRLGQHLDHVAWPCADCDYWCLPDELKGGLCHGCR